MNGLQKTDAHEPRLREAARIIRSLEDFVTVRLERLLRCWAWVLIAVIVVFTAGIRWRLRDMPLERDEGEYAFMGQLMLQGVPPYKEAYNVKLPGTYVAYAVIMSVFGQTPSAIRVGVLLVNAGSIILVFLVGRRLFDEVAGVTAAWSFAILTLSPSMLGLFGHATHFVGFFALAGAWLLLRALNAPSNTHWQILLSGLWFGLCFLMKQHGIFFGVIAAVSLVVIRLPGSGKAADPTQKPVSPTTTALTQGALFVGGLILPYVLTCLILWQAGVFDRFIFWTITYARQYGRNVPLSLTPYIFSTALRKVAEPNSWLWFLGKTGILAACIYPGLGAKKRIFLFGFAAASLASVFPGLVFRGHYFIVAMPALALLIGAGLSFAFWLIRARSKWRAFGWPILLLFPIAMVQGINNNRAIFFELTPAEASVAHYNSELFIEAREVGEYLRSRSSPGARIAVIGSEPEIYFHAHRRSATGYLYMYPLIEKRPNTVQMQLEMIAEIEANHPEYFVYVKDRSSWTTHPNSPGTLFRWWESYSQTNLTPDLSKEFKGFTILKRHEVGG